MILQAAMKQGATNPCCILLCQYASILPDLCWLLFHNNLYQSGVGRSTPPLAGLTGRSTNLIKAPVLYGMPIRPYLLFLK
jgi:hypothetical protein